MSYRQSRGGVGVGVTPRVRVEKVVLWAFLETSLLITMEPRMGHTKLPEIYALSNSHRRGKVYVGEHERYHVS